MSFGYFAAFFSSSVTPARVSYLMFCHLILHRYINLTHPRVHYDMFLFLGSHRPHLIVVSLLSHCSSHLLNCAFVAQAEGIAGWKLSLLCCIGHGQHGRPQEEVSAHPISHMPHRSHPIRHMHATPFRMPINV